LDDSCRSSPLGHDAARWIFIK